MRCVQGKLGIRFEPGRDELRDTDLPAVLEVLPSGLAGSEPRIVRGMLLRFVQGQRASGTHSAVDLSSCYCFSKLNCALAVTRLLVRAAQPNGAKCEGTTDFCECRCDGGEVGGAADLSGGAAAVA
eukprot:SAG11_NODE_2257_length_3613_cov_1.750996_3_plen_126_part_00